MQRVFSSFKEKLHSLCVNFTDAVDAPSGGGFSTMTNEELARGAMFKREQLLLHTTDDIELSVRSFFSFFSHDSVLPFLIFFTYAD